MDIRILYYRFYISCVFVLSYADCKTFSLNDVIAAEQLPSKIPENSLGYTSSASSHGKKKSSLHYKKTFQITSPSKPKKLKHLQRPLYKRKNLTSKREIQHNERNNIKYIPLLRNIGLLFDNILSSDSGETNQNRKYQHYKHKRNQYVEYDDDRVCTCIGKHGPETRSDPEETTPFTSTPIEIESETLTTTVITTTPSNNLTPDNFSGFRRHKIIPLLLARDSSGLRGNDNRFRPRSGSTYNRSSEGHITRIHGNNEHNTDTRDTKSDHKYYEEDSDSNTRNDTDSDYEFDGADKGIGRDSENSTINRGTSERKEFILSTNETIEDTPRDVSEYEGKTKFEIRRNETESPIFIPKFTTRLREYNTQESNTPIRTSESNEKGVEFDYTSNKRVFDGNGSDTTQNKKDSGTDKAITHSVSNFPIGKVVMIYDGYSVARDVNGENKLSEKAIHIHS